MSILKKTGLSAALISVMAFTAAGCDSAVITGPGNTSELDAAAAMGPTLLQDGSFEQGAETWQLCSSNGSSNITSDASQGSLGLQLSDGACRYQNQAATSGSNYRLSCDVKRNAAGYTSVTLTVLDQAFEPLASRVVAIDSSNFDTAAFTLTAPASATHIEIMLYSESDMTVDNCALTEV